MARGRTQPASGAPSAQDAAKVIKKLGTADKLPSVPAVARELGYTSFPGPVVRAIYEGELIAFPELKLPATKGGVEKGRKSGLRNERIAIRTGLPMAKVIELAEEAGVADLYLGRGRKSGGGGGTSGTSGRRAGAKTKTAPAASGRGTSGRRAGSKTKTAPAAARGRRGTRASAAADPK